MVTADRPEAGAIPDKGRISLAPSPGVVSCSGERLKQRGLKDDRFGHEGTLGWRGIGLVEAAQPGE
jgi:hypothetical protein